MKLDIITLFPSIFEPVLTASIINRAQLKKLVEINVIDLRDFTHDSYRTVDDRPYGGGAGMILKPEPLFEAVESLRTDDSHIILLSPQGTTFNQSKANKLVHYHHLILICGHYEGVDERVKSALIDEEISIGDYILTNGNLPAMVITDAIIRLVPGVLGNDQSIIEESFSHGLLEYPQYTRPSDYRDMKVPEILLSGNHKQIKLWKQEQALIQTEKKRPDLYREQKINTIN